ncbi:hypothetical protein J8L13_20870 [Bacteroides fragilis]|uniref:hypothetical protein n=1 Tax=Bacteroides fragilis TaxID=817 RepID=UPI00202F5F76|nr:hypothetical protein [Bacteroides fragilis]MCM0239829.1 hypothetical protein [Bacteroides fragilis]
MKTNNYHKEKLPFRILIIISTICTSYLFKIMEGDVKGGMSLKQYILMVTVSIIIVSIVYFSLVWIILYKKNAIGYILDRVGVNVDLYCYKYDRICYVKEAINAIKGNYKLTLNSDIAEKYNLFTEKDILEKEKKFKGEEIWVLSYDLTTESLEDETAEIVKSNLKKGIIYREFYVDNSNANLNKIKMQKKYEEYTDKLFFYSYSDPNGTLNCLYALYGIVIYKGPKENNLDAYFSLRSSNPKVTYPIYVKMPFCMTRKHYNILNKIKNT